MNREHQGVSFPMAQAAIQSRLAVEIEEQYRGGEWRTIVVAPLRGILLLQIVFAFYLRSDHENPDDQIYQEAEQAWTGSEGVLRIISARKATTDEQALYFAARPQTLG